MLRLLFALVLLLLSVSAATAQTYTARSLGGPDRGSVMEIDIAPTGAFFLRTAEGWYFHDANSNVFTKLDLTFSKPTHLSAKSGSVIGVLGIGLFLLDVQNLTWFDDGFNPFKQSIKSDVAIGSNGHVFVAASNLIAECDVNLNEAFDIDTLPVGVSVMRLVSYGDTLLAITTSKLFAQVNDGPWEILDSNLESTVRDVEFSPVGIIAGTASSGLHLLDHIGGTWRSISDNLPDWQINDVLYHNGRIYSANGNNLYMTSDLGQTWIEGKGRIRTMPVNVLAEHDGSIYAGTGREGLFISLDEGVTWEAFNGGIAESQVRAIYEYKGDIFTGSEINAVHRLSSDGKWIDQHNGIRAGATIMAFTDRNDTLYALDDRSGLYKWVPDSNAWIKRPLTFTVSSEYFDMDWLDDRTLVVISESVHILDVPTNSFTRTQFGENQIFDLEIANGKMYIAVNDGLRVSEDRGESWRMLRAGRSVKVHVIGETIVTQLIDGDIWRSDDAGETWTKFADNFGNMFRAGKLLFVRSDDSLLYTDLQSGWRLGLANILSLNELALMPSGQLLAGLNDRGLFELLPVSAVEPHHASMPDVLAVYPNPAGKSVTIETDATVVDIYNSLGQLVASFDRPAGSTFSFPVSNLTPAVYSLRAKTSEGVRTTRLVVTR